MTLWKSSSCWERFRAEGKRASEDEMAGRHHWWNERELGQTPADGEGQGSPWCCKESDTAGWMNSNNMSESSNQVLAWCPLGTRLFLLKVSSCVCTLFLISPVCPIWVPKNPPAMRDTWVRFLGWEDPLEEEMATHSSILAWRIPMEKGAWWATVHGVTKSRSWLID